VATKPPHKKTAKGGNNLKPFYWLLGIIALGGLGFIAMSALGKPKPVAAPVDLPPAAVSNVGELVKTARGIKYGQDNAPVRILVFSDFTCPACRHFATAVEPTLKQEMIETGKVQLVYYDFPLGGGAHRWGFLASRAGRCAEEAGKFWQLHDRLFTAQSEWAFRPSAPVKDFEKYATEAGIDKGPFLACLNSDKHAQLVSANKALGDQLGVGGTPTLFMNTRQLSREWQDYAALKERINRELGVPAAATTTTR
jgi:protein-disulfide isomerase